MNEQLRATQFCPEQPPTALAPMQDVTTLPFMRVVAHYGAPDFYFTEYFRVLPHSVLEKHILQSITENDTGRPVFAQLIGENIEHMVRTARELETHHPIAGVDLNMGCPAPKVYRKNVGGGLLRDPEKIDRLIGSLREAIQGSFSVKMRIGFDSSEHYLRILDILNQHEVDFVSIHGRTVKEMYRGEVHYDQIALAKEVLRCPLFANGNISSPAVAASVHRQTQADGLMVGRAAIRNPWIFLQTRQHLAGEPVFQPTLGDVREYIERLWQATDKPGFEDNHHTQFLKKFLNFIGQSVDSEGAFLKVMRRSRNSSELFAICDQFLLKDGRAAQAFALEPYPGIVARPNHEGPAREEGCSL